MKIKRTVSWFLILVIICSILPGSMAEQQESPAISFGETKYLQDGFLYEPGDRSLVYYYDYASGLRMPLCTRPNCEHRPIEQMNFNDFHFSAAEMMNETPSLCYAARLAFASELSGYVLYDRKLYFFPSFYEDPQPGTNTLPLYASEVDGETRLLTDLGYLFPANVEPMARDMLAYNGFLYIQVALVDNPSWKENESTKEVLPGTIQLIKCSMDTGEASVLGTFYAESCSVFLIGLYDDVLYYEISTANGMEPAETEWDYVKDMRSKTRYSALGIDVKTGEKVIPDQRLCDRTLVHGDGFDIVRDGILYCIVPSETKADKTALFLGYDLNKHETVLEYTFEYDDSTDFYPYFVLTDEIVLAFSFDAGVFALRNLKTNEIKPLDIPGASIHGNEGQADWYDIFTSYFQTNPLILDHCYADGTTDKAYVTVEELLGSNPQIHDFTGE